MAMTWANWVIRETRTPEKLEEQKRHTALFLQVGAVQSFASSDLSANASGEM